MEHTLVLERDSFMRPYTRKVAEYCLPFSCQDKDLGGMNYPAVLIGRLGVSLEYRGKGYNIGSQILDFIKGWFRTKDNKTGCRFIVVDAYNNDKTIHFYEKNGFKLLYKTEYEERDFLELSPEEPLETRFMFFDLKLR